MLGLCLALLLDASGSVDRAEWELQVNATAAAIEAPETVAKIVQAGGAAVWAAEFASITIPMVDWHVIRNEHDAKVFAAALVAHVRQESMSTASGDAVLAALAALRIAPSCERQVVDVSTDGWANSGALISEAIETAERQGALVNAIVIEDEPQVLEKYRDAVNGFALPATWETYAQAIKQKLNLEIAYAPVEPFVAPVVGYKPYAYVDRPYLGAGFGRQDDALVALLPGDRVARRYLDLSNDIRRRPDVPGPGGFATLAAGLVILAAAGWRRR